MMLSSEVGAVTVGFLRLLRRVTHAIVVVPWTVDDGTLETMGDPVGLREKPSTLKNVNALPLCPDPPSQAARRAATAKRAAGRPTHRGWRSSRAKPAIMVGRRVMARVP